MTPLILIFRMSQGNVTEAHLKELLRSEIDCGLHKALQRSGKRLNASQATRMLTTRGHGRPRSSSLFPRNPVVKTFTRVLSLP